ncbi:HD domain-containing protein [Acidicapsa dinghuensis]|uniref:HD domain-containing protein n=1 Tax=Acidicapsa dinghuensis TaxID=2218256 RepID=A0ABW1EFR6_9BACT|nr:HD domain-containing protein [Acidicapsa dinghuensis]
MHPSHFTPFESLAAAIIPHLPQTTDGSHDHDHLLRVWNTVKAIQAQEGGDLELLAAAVLLHDCVLVPKESPLRSQASELAAKEAAGVLQSQGWSAERTEIVCDAIRTHGYSAGRTPTSLEGRILQDADRLDAIGYIGIARCFYTAGRMHSQLYNPADPTANARPLNDRHFALDHFPQKLLKLGANFTTATGQALAVVRVKALANFYEGMLAEVTGGA